MTKSELRGMIREVLKEELASMETFSLTEGLLLEAAGKAPDECILAYHVMLNPDANTALETRDAKTLLAVVDAEMEKNDLYTPGAQTFRKNVVQMTGGMDVIPYALRDRVARYIGDSYLKAAGMGMTSFKKR